MGPFFHHFINVVQHVVFEAMKRVEKSRLQHDLRRDVDIHYDLGK